jgi:hypothetical protein
MLLENPIIWGPPIFLGAHITKGGPKGPNNVNQGPNETISDQWTIYGTGKVKPCNNSDMLLKNPIIWGPPIFLGAHITKGGPKGPKNVNQGPTGIISDH